MKTLVDQLKSLITGKVCIVGIGNRIKADDAAGPMIIDTIQASVKAVCVDAGVAPENVLEKIAECNPTTLLIIDAVDFDGAPGDIRILEPDTIRDQGALSTHALSLPMLKDYLSRRTSASIFLIGIQPQTLELDKEPSRPVLKAIDRLSDILLETIGTGNEKPYGSTGVSE